VVARVNDEPDVVEAVKFARQNRKKAVGRGGGWGTKLSTERKAYFVAKKGCD